MVEVGCKLMVVPIVRMLSLANQLCAIGKRVTLTFLEGEAGAMGYLDRIGFFDYLSPDAIVLPSCPLFSGANMHFEEIRTLSRSRRMEKATTLRRCPIGWKRRSIPPAARWVSLGGMSLAAFCPPLDGGLRGLSLEAPRAPPGIEGRHVPRYGVREARRALLQKGGGALGRRPRDRPRANTAMLSMRCASIG